MKVAITSQNLKAVTGHAGKTRKFIFYDVDADGRWQQEQILKLPKEMSMHEFRGTDHPLDDLDVIITAGCGEGFIRKMQRRGVRVITTSETSLDTAITSFSQGQELPPAEPHHH